MLEKNAEKLSDISRAIKTTPCQIFIRNKIKIIVKRA